MTMTETSDSNETGKRRGTNVQDMSWHAEALKLLALGHKPGEVAKMVKRSEYGVRYARRLASMKDKTARRSDSHIVEIEHHEPRVIRAVYDRGRVLAAVRASRGAIPSARLREMLLGLA